jgi:hypothetical protein
MSVYSSLIGDSQQANELTQWKPREVFAVWSVLTNSITGFSVWSVQRLYNATLVIFSSQYQMRRVPDEKK